MQMEVLDNPEAVARRAAAIVAEWALAAVGARGRFVFAVSGGQTPWLMLRTLAAGDLPWDKVHIVQVDERIAVAGDPQRNLTHLRESLRDQILLPPWQIYPMPVESRDLIRGAVDYAATLCELAGTPPVLDLVHLGLGADGHTASLLPDDPVLKIADQDVALSGPREGHCRMTLTLPVLNRARHILWIVTGAEKAEMLKRLSLADRSIPAGCVRQTDALAVVDRAAAALLVAGSGARSA